MRDLEHENIMRTTTSIWAHLDVVGDEFTNHSYNLKEEVIVPL